MREVLYQIKIKTLDLNRRKIQEEFSSAKGDIASFDVETKYSYSLGKCYSVRPKPDIVRLGITEITIIAHMDNYVYMGYPGQFMYNIRTRVNVQLK